MQKNIEIIEGEITDLSSKGWGVLKGKNGMVFFIPYTWPGDIGTFKILKKEKRYGMAEVVEISQYSPERITPPCPHHGAKKGQCGGCPWMIANYQSQLKYKNNRIKFILEKIGVNNQVNLNKIIPSPISLGYRNRAQLKTDGAKIGFVSHNSNELAPIKDCLALSLKTREILQDLLKSLPRNEWTPQGSYQWNFIEIDEEIDATQAQLNIRRPFRQANDSTNLIMKNWLTEVTSLFDKNAPFLELFCGNGNFTKVLCENGFSKIFAVDCHGDSINQLKQLNLPSLTAIDLNLFKKGIWKELKKKCPDKIKYLLLDPPREGLKNKKGLYLAYPEVEKIIYISCDPDSFAMDAKDLIAHNFNLVDLQPIDQFPQTKHIEILAIFSKSY